jgi:transcriptional regulator with XRE-family HTH domain
MTATHLPQGLLMAFGERLTKLRKQRALTQQALADKAGMHVVQIRRYETDASQPSLEAIRKLATALSVSADALVFDEDERGPADDNLKLQFEAVAQLSPDERKTIQTVIDGILLMHDAKRYTQRDQQAN